MGVRISWLMLASMRLLARLAASACNLASSSAFSLRRRKRRSASIAAASAVRMRTCSARSGPIAAPARITSFPSTRPSTDTGRTRSADRRWGEDSATSMGRSSRSAAWTGTRTMGRRPVSPRVPYHTRSKPYCSTSSESRHRHSISSDASTPTPRRATSTHWKAIRLDSRCCSSNVFIGAIVCGSARAPRANGGTGLRGSRRWRTERRRRPTRRPERPLRRSPMW